MPAHWHLHSGLGRNAEAVLLEDIEVVEIELETVLVFVCTSQRPPTPIATSRQEYDYARSVHALEAAYLPRTWPKSNEVNDSRGPDVKRF